MTPTRIVFPLIPRPDPPVPGPGVQTFFRVPNSPTVRAAGAPLESEARADEAPDGSPCDDELLAQAGVRTAIETVTADTTIVLRCSLIAVTNPFGPHADRE